MMSQRMELKGAERAKYFAPTTICIYLATLCAVLIITSAFLKTMQDAIAVTAAGLFGLLLSSALGFAFFWSQRRDLSYHRISTSSDEHSNFCVARAALHNAGWRVTFELPDRQLDALTTTSQFSFGERVAVRFMGSDVLVASICDPSVGYSLIGRRRCIEHREVIRRALSDRPAGSAGIC